ncbi:putative MOSC domain-containing protein 2, mitochondrial-like isoform X2 [Capsicum annuum]|nr:putative MOSC domain-containing protein 2, mitochondrial-like isoform X2 [Capsicum annuum]
MTSLVSTSPFWTVIRAPGMDVLKVPLVEPSEVAHGVSVWEWSGSALDEGDEASKWFSKYLGKPSRLVRFNEGANISWPEVDPVSQSRPTDPNYAPGYKIKFNDAYPFLLTSQVPTINQETAEAGSEPSETLMKFRSDEVLKTNKKPQGRIYFGQHLVWVDSLAQERKTIKVEDPVYVLKMVSSYVDVSV